MTDTVHICLCIHSSWGGRFDYDTCSNFWNMIRLQKLLAIAGVTSRRKAELLILEGRVLVNGEAVTELGAKAQLTDDITVDGIKLSIQKKTYIKLYKPMGVISSAKDNFGRKTVLDLVPCDVRLFPVGRLDYDTSGLILLTNDGEWANKLMHPGNKVNKTYIAMFDGTPTEEGLEAFREGLYIEGKKTAPCKIFMLSKDSAKITLHEGRNRQVRKMCEAIGLEVLKLKRVSIGALELGKLKPGEWRYLTEEEIHHATQNPNLRG